jgi:hypothetical protein
MADVKLLASQRLTDNPDGGGLMTSIEIVDGVVNNLWPDISRVDRAFGVDNLRKLFCKADTPDTAIYSGLHIICLMPPQDPRVSVTMFTTNNWSDVRANAQSAMERYLDRVRADAHDPVRSAARGSAHDSGLSAPRARSAEHRRSVCAHHAR